jgi:protein subunit release factor A
MTGLVSSLAVALAIAAQTAAPRPDDPPTSQAIVQELRLLREAVEQVLATSVRVQLLMGRLQLQEARIQALIRQGSEIDSELAGMASERESLTNQRRRLERVAEKSTDPEEREFATQQVASLAERLKQIEARHASLLVEQANVQQLVLTEQTRWDDFNNRLEELERVLGSAKR